MPGTFDLIKDYADVVEIIGQRVSLRRSGSGFTGLCPFHDERTPSFHVNVEWRSFRCFGCGASGDVFTFLERTEGLSRGAALTEVARRSGVEHLLHGRTMVVQQ